MGLFTGFGRNTRRGDPQPLRQVYPSTGHPRDAGHVSDCGTCDPWPCGCIQWPQEPAGPGYGRFHSFLSLVTGGQRGVSPTLPVSPKAANWQHLSQPCWLFSAPCEPGFGVLRVNPQHALLVPRLGVRARPPC